MGLEMRILIFSDMYPPYYRGGAEYIAQLLAEELVEQGHEVFVVSTMGPEMTQSKEELTNIPKIIRFFPKSPFWVYEIDQQPRYKKLAWHLRELYNPNAAATIADLIREIAPDLVHTHNIDSFSPLIWKVIKQAGLPLVHTAHDYHLVCPKSNLINGKGKVCTNPHLACHLWRYRSNQVLKNVDLFVSPSQFLVSKVTEEGLKPKKIRIIPNGVKIPKEESRSYTTPKENEPVRLVSIGRLSEIKGILVLLDAMRRIPATLPVRLAIAGSGPLEKEVRAAVASDARISYHGFLSGEEKERFFDADLLLYTSTWYENLPTNILEASVRGLGVLASNLGGAIELVNESNGEKFPAGDSIALAKAIERHAADREKITRFRHTAPLAARKYSVQIMAKAYLEAYQEVLETV